MHRVHAFVLNKNVHLHFLFHYIIKCVPIVPMNSISGCDHVAHRLAHVKEQPQFISQYQLIPLQLMMENLNIVSCKKKYILDL